MNSDDRGVVLNANLGIRDLGLTPLSASWKLYEVNKPSDLSESYFLLRLLFSPSFFMALVIELGAFSLKYISGSF